MTTLRNEILKLVKRYESEAHALRTEIVFPLDHLQDMPEARKSARADTLTLVARDLRRVLGEGAAK